MDALVAPVAQPSARAQGWIIPVRGLWIVGGVLALLVIAIAGNWLWALDFFHVAFGGLWTGIDLFMGFVIGPALGRMEPAARVQLVRRLMPQMMLIMPTLVITTLVAGWQLARHVGVLTVAYPQHWWVVASFVVVGVMTIVAYGFLEPVNIAVLLQLRKERPNVELIGRLMRGFATAAGILGAMQLATLVIMTRIATW